LAGLAGIIAAIFWAALIIAVCASVILLLLAACGAVTVHRGFGAWFNCSATIYKVKRFMHICILFCAVVVGAYNPVKQSSSNLKILRLSKQRGSNYPYALAVW
jgi:hypothetical protein